MAGVLGRLLIALGIKPETAIAIANFVRLGMILLILKKILDFLWLAAKTPLFLGAMVAALTFFPDTIGWIFIKLGEIELRVMALVLSVVMPDVFGAGSQEYSSWAAIWQQGLNMLPTQMVEVINGLGVAQILGMVSATISAVCLIKIYRRAMIRAGMM